MIWCHVMWWSGVMWCDDLVSCDAVDWYHIMRWSGVMWCLVPCDVMIWCHVMQWSACHVKRWSGVMRNNCLVSCYHVYWHLLKQCSLCLNLMNKQNNWPWCPISCTYTVKYECCQFCLCSPLTELAEKQVCFKTSTQIFLLLYYSLSSSSASVRLGRRWCSSIIEPICTSLNGCADQLVSGNLCHIWCRRKELAAGDICPAPSVCSSCLRRLWSVPLLQTLHLAWQFVSKMGDHQRCFPMSYCRCCIASCLSCRHPWSAVWGDQRVVDLPPARRTRDLWVCDLDPSSWHGLTSGVVSVILLHI